MALLARTALAILLVAPALAIAQAPGDSAAGRAGARPHAPNDALLRADSNQDGQVSVEELRALRPGVTDEMFKRLDQDGDGFLTATDRRAQANRTPGADDANTRVQLFGRFMQSDANNDGKVSFEELTSARPGFPKQDFDRIDRNSDGFITQDDMQRQRTIADRPKPPRKPATGAAPGDGPQRDVFRKRMLSADANQDGKISFSEMKTTFPGLNQERFDALDRDKDGLISPEDRLQGQRPRTPAAPDPSR
jgi:Ca2+-binding EF-hand superfamily protein